jgi:hypothetical protein
MTDTGGPSVPEDPDAPTPSTGVPRQEFAPAPPEPPRQPSQQWASPVPQGPSYQDAPPPVDPRWHPQGYGKPGVIALRPLNVGDMLDGAIKAIRRHPGLILGASAIVAVVSSGLTLIAQLWVLPPIPVRTQLGVAATQQQQLDQLTDMLGPTAISAVVTLAIALLTRTFLAGFLTVVMGKAVLGKPVTLGEALREAKPRWLPLIGLTVVYTLAVMAGSILCIIGAVVPYVFFALASPALVLERGRIGQSLGRSRRLVSGSFWRVFGILLLAALLGWVVSLIIQTPFAAGNLLNVFSDSSVQSTGSLVLQSVGSMIAEAIVTPFVALVTVLIYIDLRMRKEGMDIELARAAGVTPPTPPQAW